MKNLKNQCPSHDDIQLLLHEDATEEQLEFLAAHLDTCEQCRRFADSMSHQAALESDLHWASEVRNQTSVSVDEPLRRLSKILPEYNLICEIGRGGMGIVYKAEQPKLHRTVAIKVLPALIGVVRPEYRARFQREAELAAGLDHTNIISVHDFGEADGTLYYTMQLIDGRSLRDVLTEIQDTGAVDCVIGPESSSSVRSSARLRSASGTPEVRQEYFRKVAHWIAEVADAMQYAHNHGVIHRDIKPSNLLLTNDGRLMISDFGLARPRGVEGMTMPHSLLGTARYMAPEQFASDISQERDDLHLVDIYALGATLYELLAFRPVFSAPDDRQVVHQIQNHDAIPPSRFVRQIPTGLETVCMKAISRDRRDRYANAEEFADDLRRWALDMPIRARRQTFAERSVRFVKRRKGVAILAMTSLILAASSGGMYLRANNAQIRADQSRISEERERAEKLTGQAMAFVNSEQFTQAVSSADEALGTIPGFAPAIHAKAIALHRMGKEGEAAALLRDAIERDPDDWYSGFLLGMENHAGHGTKNHGRSSEKDHPGSDESMRLSAALGGYIAKIKQINPGSAELYALQSCVEPDHDRAIELLDHAIELDPGLTYALVEKASRLGSYSEYAQALELLDKAVALGHGGHQIHGFRGIAYYELGEHAKAVDAMGEAIARYDGNSDWWYNRAVAYSYLGEYERTIEDANATIEIDPTYSGAYMVRARAHTSLGRAEDALADFTTAIEHNPSNGDIYVERGQLFWLAGDYANSLRDANTLIELEPNQLRGYQRRASTNLMLQNWDEALSDLDRCDELIPGQETVYRLRGGVLFHAGRYNESIDAFSESIAMLPGFFGSYEYRAMALLRLGRYQESVADLTSWISIGDRRSFAFMRRGMVYEIMGEKELALKDYAMGSQYPELRGYPELWSAILTLLDPDLPSTDLLQKCREHEYSGAWINTVLDLFEQKITVEEFRALAPDLSNDEETLYYLGVHYLGIGETELAAEALSESASSRRLNIHEIDFAYARYQKLVGQIQN